MHTQCQVETGRVCCEAGGRGHGIGVSGNRMKGSYENVILFKQMCIRVQCMHVRIESVHYVWFSL